jgi:hypothetical protein
LKDSGALITSSMVDSYIKEVAPKISKTIAGVSDKDVEIASKYLSEQVKMEWCSEFLTNDLMKFLDADLGEGKSKF